MTSTGTGAARTAYRMGWIGLAWATVVSAATASGLDQLHAFLEGTQSAQGSFRQVVVNKDKRTTQTTAGTFAFQRPGKFRWTYDKPFDQVIVGDGDKVWVYDRDLNQVIVRKLDAALGATPAALLAGDNALERNFTLVSGGEGDGVQYVDATPKSAESQFTRIRLGFADNLPRRMQLTDAFGQTTELTFVDMQRNPKLAVETFRFTPPKGADVVGQ
ncbi:MAG TPA: outer membrane lipoprotein chaperone LolA [Casimicrobiaceae bacterium]|nr:outer membrane lipoprotein chaperone LolA [Casimicrobiaceae bacterium]